MTSPPLVMKRWYVIHTQTGHEERVKQSIEARVAASPLKDQMSQVVIPMERVSEVKSGKKRITERKFFPGYILVEMELNDETWYLVRNTPGVTGFVGAGKRPLPLPELEVREILRQIEERREKPAPKTVFEKGEAVKVVEGPFMNFNGTIEELHPQRGKLKVAVSIFGRATPVELEYWQVEKI